MKRHQFLEGTGSRFLWCAIDGCGAKESDPVHETRVYRVGTQDLSETEFRRYLDENRGKSVWVEVVA